MPVSSASLYTIAVTGGKGGVGKTNIAVNLALAMTQLGAKVGILDADLGLANVDVVLRLNPRYTLKHVIAGERTIEEVIVKGPLGLSVIPASSGIQALANLPDAERRLLIEELGCLSGILDVLIVDTPAGIGDNVMSFVMAADEILVITTSDPPAYTDAYALIKIISQHGVRRIHLAVNMVRSVNEARDVAEILQKVAKQFQLNIKGISFAGYLPYEVKFRDALRGRTPLILEYPDARSTKCIQLLAKRMLSIGQQRPKGKDFFADVEMFQSGRKNG